VLIHHDYSKSYLDPNHFSAIPNVYVMSDFVEVEWGDFSLTKAILRCIDWALDHLKFDWFVFLSGQDYPIKPLPIIEKFLRDSGYDALLRGFQVVRPNSWPKGEGQSRYFVRYYKLPRFKYYHRFPSEVKALLSHVKVKINRTQALIQIRTPPRGLPPRIGFRCLRTPFNERFECYGGPTWFDASHACLSYIREFVGSNPSYVAWYARTFIADESFFATILLNQPKFKILLDNKRFVHWNPADPNAASPRVIESKEIDGILNSRAHFARKFDVNVDPHVLDLIDQRIGYRLEAANA
jgi:hypothetical protein